MARILIADDHDIVRRGVCDLLAEREDWEVCAEARNGAEAVELAGQLKPDVVVLDLSMPDINGILATRQIRKLSPETEILIFTMHESEHLIHEVLAAGARGYLVKSSAGRELTRAIDQLLKHKPYLSPSVAEAVLDGYLHPEQKKRTGPSLYSQLSDREIQIVQLLSQGLTSKRIGGSLGISVKTVETHRANIMRKLGVGSIAELVRYAVRNNLVIP
ncbi:MAG TPA: response regulator transcription factor [Hypericibacter adhaerens]|uniref:DNA-binding response regulator n=1 Tax=Hypericibacter adhaerens TaxID=2602016 RepID=A0A5J6N4Y4_9PROT|nr:response regulator transcription factor [Hypericibacter adhaerens]QEX21966.1 DNA-binding response regulator [Hypericibacter adhaerens]HWA45212.1 response regulator transcription factor [Hypericibacter adhaerens]